MINNTYIKYSELLSILQPYFLSRGGEDFLKPSQIGGMINFAIQDIYNDSKLSFASEFDICEPEANLYKNNFYVYKTEKPINLIEEILIDGKGDNMAENIVGWMPKSGVDEFHFKKGTNIILTSQKYDTITVNYTHDFERNPLANNEDLNKEVPVPYAYIPALVNLIYDWSSPMTFFRGDGNEFDFFGHGQSRLNKLSARDELTSERTVDIN